MWSVCADAKVYQDVVHRAKPEVIQAMSMDRHRTMGVDRGTVAAYSIVSDVIAGAPIKIQHTARERKASQLRVAAVGLASGQMVAAAAMGNDAKGSDGKLLVMKRPDAEITRKTNMASVEGEQTGNIVR
jgi:hypothetical protein